jgi:hypothetical protein
LVAVAAASCGLHLLGHRLLWTALWRRERRCRQGERRVRERGGDREKGGREGLPG